MKLAVLAVVAVCVGIAHGQQSAPVATLAGVVTDATGAVLPGATITITGPDGTKSVATNSSGKFLLQVAETGVYKVGVANSLFVSQSLDVKLVVGTTFEWNPRLQLVPSKAKPLEDYIEAFIGKGFLDCGTNPPDASSAAMLKSLQCATEASAAKRAFATVKNFIGVDSVVRRGLVASTDGMIYVFDYDGSPCGNPLCEARFTTERCYKPSVKTSEIGLVFSCGSQALEEFRTSYALSYQPKGVAIPKPQALSRPSSHVSHQPQ